MSDTAASERDKARLVEVTLDEESIGNSNADVTHERQVAIFDLLEDNKFALQDHEGPYRLHLSQADNRLVFAIGDAEGRSITDIGLPLSPFRRMVKDYFLMCESYFQAIKTAPASRIEALDQNRRALHDEGSHLLKERLQDKIDVDMPTARRLFTLLCALHWKG